MKARITHLLMLWLWKLLSTGSKLKEGPGKGPDKALISPGIEKKVEDECVCMLVAVLWRHWNTQLRTESSREHLWHLDYVIFRVGYEETKTEITLHGEKTPWLMHTYQVKGGLGGWASICGAFPFLKQFEDSVTVAKQTIPALHSFMRNSFSPF